MPEKDGRGIRQWGIPDSRFKIDELGREEVIRHRRLKIPQVNEGKAADAGFSYGDDRGGIQLLATPLKNEQDQCGATGSKILSSRGAAAKARA